MVITPALQKKLAHDAKVLGITIDEALEMAMADKAIDKGEDLFPLTAEQKKVEKEMRQADRTKNAPTAYKFTKRERKENATKAGIIAQISTFLAENGEIAYENVVITNKERQIAFNVGENQYEFTLVQKRKPKN